MKRSENVVSKTEYDALQRKLDECTEIKDYYCKELSCSEKCNNNLYKRISELEGCKDKLSKEVSELRKENDSLKEKLTNAYGVIISYKLLDK